MEQPTGTPTTPAGVSLPRTLVSDLDETMWVAKTSEELVEAVVVAERLRAHLAALEAAVVAEVHARGVAKQELAWGSTAEWFTHLAGTHRGTGHQTIRHADTLVTSVRPTPRWSRAGLTRAGAVIVTRSTGSPPTPGGDGEAFLLDAATRLNATDLAKAARTWSRSPTPTPPNARPRRSWTGRTGPPTTTGPPGDRRGRAGGIRLRGRHRRGRRRDQGRPPPAHQAAPSTRGPDGDQLTDPGTTAPGCGTRWSRPAGTP
ncbi:hypothetical protein [Nocardioides ungokensis]|uniref:hypothetical protein n=1 Tax=Nocardioides ungokensis TaxID=1643322 RepID=UPI0015E0157D|nr:hypothetical protein [Nocardioides ungokensis]